MKVFNPQLIANILFSASIYLLIGISFYLVFYVTKIFHVFHAALITVGAYLTYLFVIQYQLPMAISVGFSLILTVALGLAGEKLVYTPLRKKSAPPLSFLIVSIGLYIILENIIAIYFGSNTKVIQVGTGTSGYALLGAYLTGIQLVTICTATLLFTGVFLFLRFTRYGRSIRAVASNPVLSKIYGINASWSISIAMAASAFLAATTGILLAMDTSMTPSFGFNVLIYGVAVIMIGGMGNITGQIVGAFLLSITQHLIGFYADARWMETIAYIILILFLLWKPLGFSGKKIKKIEI